MGNQHIRLNDYFVLRKGRKYYVTSVKKHTIWSGMDAKQKERVKGKDVTLKIKALLKKHGSKSNINFKTKPSKKKIRKTNRKKRGVRQNTIKKNQVGG